MYRCGSGRGGGRWRGGAVDDLEAVEDVELAGIGHDGVVAGATAGHVGCAVAQVDLVVAVVGEDDIEPAARRDRDRSFSGAAGAGARVLPGSGG